MDDRTLVEAVIRGDQHAFEQIVERETAAVFHACYRILGRLHDAEDATQESFVTAYRALGTFRGEGTLAAWLARIAVRHALRAATRRREAIPIDAEAAGGLASGTGDPLGDALDAERGRLVRAAVAGLPEPYREIVALRFFADLSLAEIALATDHPIGTVKSYLHRGLERLRDRLGVEVAA